MPGIPSIRARRLVAVAALGIALGCGAGGPSSGPAASDEEISHRVVDYFQKTVTTPGLAFKVTKVEDAEIPGWRKGNLQVSLAEQSKDIAFYVSRDGRYLFRGDAVDLSVDPLKQVMSNISLDGQPSRGPNDAKVVMVEYSDFECPYCARASSTLEDDILKTYGDKVRFVFKNFPLNIHHWAEDAAVASECAFQQGNDRFWPVYSGLFAAQGQITKENLREKASDIAGKAGLDVPKFQECFDGKKTLDAVRADEKEGNALGINSTPTFFVNGRRLAGAQTPESFKQVLDQELGAKAPNAAAHQGG